MYRLANHALVLKALNEAIDVLKDDTLVWRRSSRAPKGTINTHALDDMTAVATSLLFLYQDSLRFLKIYPKSTKLLTIVKTIEKTFANKANKEPFLYPHFMKLYEAIKNPQPAYVAPPQKTHAIS
ncbi:hypothetical protein O181_031712 [Austropuccinia psidii MF-1]|uniref:Uncharacterized protein n=1 Tax=Austropuccinia psidii MF-1 TaxID=1389203 RepID=A0A9Q3H5L3_9BASI|nr:hypothetical protein [Austropuccinia psidii MF-1]